MVFFFHFETNEVKTSRPDLQYTMCSQGEDHCINFPWWTIFVQDTEKVPPNCPLTSPQTDFIIVMNYPSKTNKHLFSTLQIMFIFCWGGQVKMENGHFMEWEIIDEGLREKKEDRIIKQCQKDLKDTEQISFFNYKKCQMKHMRKSWPFVNDLVTFCSKIPAEVFFLPLSSLFWQ